MLNLDTHIVVALLSGELHADEQRAITAEAIGISDIVLWELSKLVQLKRIQMDLSGNEFSQFLRAATIFPITLAIAQESTKLDFHSDPADELIAATSIVENIPLITRDRQIRKSRLVQLAT